MNNKLLLLFLFFHSYFFGLFASSSKENITISNNLSVLGNASFLTNTKFAKSLIINPISYQGNITINGKIYLSSNIILIGNDFSNTVLTIQNLDTAPNNPLFYLAIDLNTNTLYLLPITQTKLTIDSGDNYSVQTVQTNTLSTNNIQSQILIPNTNAITIGNTGNTLTLNGNNVYLNAENDFTSSTENLTITSDLEIVEIHLQSAGNGINSLSIDQNFTGISGITMNFQGTENNFTITNAYTTEYASDNTVNLSAKTLSFIGDDPNNIAIQIGYQSDTNVNQFIITNILPNDSQNNTFLLLNDQTNTILSTNLIPNIKETTTPKILLDESSTDITTVTIANIMQCGNTSGSLTLEANSIVFPNIINAADMQKLHHAERIIEDDRQMKILQFQIDELLKEILRKKNHIEKNPELQQKLQFFLEKRGQNE
jgi:hypothetical protein